MTNNVQTSNGKTPYDLEERTFEFAKNIALFCKTLPKSLSNHEYAEQLVRSSSSIGANYIEANESLSKKDFYMRIKISRKEAKETAYWIKLLLETNTLVNTDTAITLFNESIELKKIFSSILLKQST